MNNAIDYYELLNVPEGASNEEIKRAYRDLVRLHHPDKGGSNHITALLNRAYEVLSDPVERSKYDAERVNGASAPASESIDTEHAAYAAGGWPHVHDVRDAFHMAYTSYGVWLGGGKPKSGHVYEEMREALELLVVEVLESGGREGVLVDISDVMDAVAVSMPALISTEAAMRAMLHAPFASVPRPESISFPVELDHYYAALVGGRNITVPGIGTYSAERALAEQAFIYLSYIARFYGDLTPRYVVAAKRKYPKALESRAFEYLLIAIERPNVSAALDEWSTWADGYFAAGGWRHNTMSPAMQKAGQVANTAVTVAAVAAGATARLALNMLVIFVVIVVLGLCVLSALLSG